MAAGLCPWLIRGCFLFSGSLVWPVGSPGLAPVPLPVIVLFVGTGLGPRSAGGRNEPFVEPVVFSRRSFRRSVSGADSGSRSCGLLRGFRTAELVVSSTLPRLAVDNHSGLRSAAGNRARSAGVGCCKKPFDVADDVAPGLGFSRVNGPVHARFSGLRRTIRPCCCPSTRRCVPSRSACPGPPPGP